MKKIYIGFNMYYDVYQSGKRAIHAPSKELKRIQKLILSFIKTKYQLKLNISGASNVHCGQKWVLKLDIRKFYESFSDKQLRETIALIYKNIDLPEDMTKKYLFEFLTINGKLPTGAPTSPYLANIAFAMLEIDDKILEFCKQEKINYSRYMDDMFFSCESKAKLKKAEKVAVSLLKENGFNINHEKTQYISDNKRQTILGVVVNNGKVIRIPYQNKHEYRALFFNYLKSVYLEEKLGINTLFLKKIGIKEVCGHLAYLKSVDYKFYLSMKEYLKIKIRKFCIYNNKEIKQLRNIIK